MHTSSVRPVTRFLLHLLQGLLWVGLLGPGAHAAPVPTSVGAAQGAAASRSIGPAGGQVSLPDGSVTVDVPAGALSRATVVAIQPISNTSPAKFGRAVRLSPEGVTFARPVRVTFRFTARDLAATAPATLRVAYRTAQGYWSEPATQRVNVAERTVSVETPHFSDWSVLPGAQITPWSGQVRIGQTLALKVQTCDELTPDDPDNPLDLPLTTCTDAPARLVSGWAVNGVPGGAPASGTVAAQGAQATFQAPSTLPPMSLAAVSATFQGPDGPVTLVSNVDVFDQRLAGSFTYEDRAGLTADTVLSYRVSGYVEWAPSGGLPGTWTPARGWAEIELFTAAPDCTLQGQKLIVRFEEVQVGGFLMLSPGAVVAADLAPTSGFPEMSYSYSCSGGDTETERTVVSSLWRLPERLRFQAPNPLPVPWQGRLVWTSGDRQETLTWDWHPLGQ